MQKELYINTLNIQEEVPFNDDSDEFKLILVILQGNLSVYSYQEQILERVIVPHSDYRWLVSCLIFMVYNVQPNIAHVIRKCIFSLT